MVRISVIMFLVFLVYLFFVFFESVFYLIFMWCGKGLNLWLDIMFKVLFSVFKFFFLYLFFGKKMLFCFFWDELLSVENIDLNDI